MSYFMVKYHKQGQKRTDRFEKIMFEADTVAGAQEQADRVTRGAGGATASLEIFNELELVSTRTAEGRWIL
jgi:HD superfamily phosphohydrolase YqeK